MAYGGTVVKACSIRRRTAHSDTTVSASEVPGKCRTYALRPSTLMAIRKTHIRHTRSTKTLSYGRRGATGSANAREGTITAWSTTSTTGCGTGTLTTHAIHTSIATAITVADRIQLKGETPHIDRVDAPSESRVQRRSIIVEYTTCQLSNNRCVLMCVCMRMTNTGHRLPFTHDELLYYYTTRTST